MSRHPADERRNAGAPQAAAAPRELITLQDAAERYQLHTDTIRRKISAGELTGYRFGQRSLRIDPLELAALFKVVPTSRSAVKAR